MRTLYATKPIIPKKPRNITHLSFTKPECKDCKHSFIRQDGVVLCKLFDLGNHYYSDYIAAYTARANEDLCGEYALHFTPKTLTKDYIAWDEWW